MKRTPVTSSNVASVGWDDGTLEVEFTSGQIYQYFDVPEHIWRELVTTESVGKYLNANIKNTYRFGKVVPGIDPRTGRPFGDHGTANDAIDYVLSEEGPSPYEVGTFLEDWSCGAAAQHWPEFYDWLAARENEVAA